MQLLYQGNHMFFFHITRSLDYPRHLQNALEFVYLMEGTCHVRCGDAERWLQPGQAFVVFPNQIHSYDGSRNVRAFLLIVPVQPYLSAYAATLFREVPEEPCLEAGELLPLLEMMYADLEKASETMMQGYLQVLVGKLLQRLRLRDVQTGPEEALHKVLLYLEAHYREPLTRQQVARAVGYSESYLSHIFSAALDTTMPEYINTLRVREAMNLLPRTDMTVSQMAAELGFGSIRNFNRAFKKETGQTPAQFRKLKIEN